MILINVRAINILLELICVKTIKQIQVIKINNVIVNYPWFHVLQNYNQLYFDIMPNHQQVAVKVH